MRHAAVSYTACASSRSAEEKHDSVKRSMNDSEPGGPHEPRRFASSSWHRGVGRSSGRRSRGRAPRGRRREHTVPRVRSCCVSGARGRGSRLSNRALRRRYMPGARLADRPSRRRRLHLERAHERGTELANRSVRSTDVPMDVEARGPSVRATDGAWCRNRVAHRRRALSRRDDARSIDGCDRRSRDAGDTTPLRSISDIG